MAPFWFLLLLALAHDHAEYVYRDTGPGRRPVAVVDAVVFAPPTSDVAFLVITARARDPRLPPALGPHGIRGENRVTAGELAHLLDGRHEIVTEGAATVLFREAGEGALTGRAWTERPESFLERRDAPRVDRVQALVRAPRAGLLRTVVRVHGEDRLVVTWSGQRPRILSLRQPELDP